MQRKQEHLRRRWNRLLSCAHPKLDKHGITIQVKLGSGGYGTVYKGTRNREPIVVKLFDLIPGIERYPDINLENARNSIIGFLYEIVAQFHVKAAKHQNRPGLQHISTVNDPIQENIFITDRLQGAIVYPFVTYTSMDNFMDRYFPKLPWYREKVLKSARSLATSILALHQEGLVHLDVKPDNIILDETIDPVLIDLGFLCSKTPLPAKDLQAFQTLMTDMASSVTDTRTIAVELIRVGFANADILITTESCLYSHNAPGYGYHNPNLHHVLSFKSANINDLFGLGITLYEFAVGFRMHQTSCSGLKANYENECEDDARAAILYIEQNPLSGYERLYAFILQCIKMTETSSETPDEVLQNYLDSTQFEMYSSDIRTA